LPVLSWRSYHKFLRNTHSMRELWFLRFFQKNIWMVFLFVWCAGIHSPSFDNLVLQQQASSSLRAFRDFFLWFFLFNFIFSAKEVFSGSFFCFYFVGRI
jgi:hypothetical protein